MRTIRLLDNSNVLVGVAQWGRGWVCFCLHIGKKWKWYQDQEEEYQVRLECASSRCRNFIRVMADRCQISGHVHTGAQYSSAVNMPHVSSSSSTNQSAAPCFSLIWSLTLYAVLVWLWPWITSILARTGENYQVCSVQYCVQQLCTVRCTHIWTDG